MQPSGTRKASDKKLLMLSLAERSANLQTMRADAVLKIIVITEVQDRKGALKAKRLRFADRFHLGERGIVCSAQVTLIVLVDSGIQRREGIARCGAQAFAGCNN